MIRIIIIGGLLSILLGFSLGTFYSSHVPTTPLGVISLPFATPTPNQNNVSVSSRLGSIDKTLTTLKPKEDWASWAAVVVALLLGLGGIFSIQDIIKRRRHKPVMKVRIKLESPDSLRIAFVHPATGQFSNYTYYFRFRVENTGSYQMQDVEVMATELEKKGGNNRYTKIKSFLPMNMKWSNVGIPTVAKIQHGLLRYCDFGHIVESAQVNLAQFGITANPQVVFILDTEVTPTTGSNILLPGDYRIKFVFAANNIKPLAIWFKLSFRDQWTTNEQQMLGQFVSIEKITP